MNSHVVNLVESPLTCLSAHRKGFSGGVPIADADESFELVHDSIGGGYHKLDAPLSGESAYGSPIDKCGEKSPKLLPVLLVILSRPRTNASPISSPLAHHVVTSSSPSSAQYLTCL